MKKSVYTKLALSASELQIRKYITSKAASFLRTFSKRGSGRKRTTDSKCSLISYQEDVYNLLCELSGLAGSSTPALLI